MTEPLQTPQHEMQVASSGFPEVSRNQAEFLESARKELSGLQGFPIDAEIVTSQPDIKQTELKTEAVVTVESALSNMHNIGEELDKIRAAIERGDHALAA